MPETKQTGRPLSYYMRNGLWHFTQPPDTLSGQVIPKSTVEQWLEKTLEMEAEITRIREQVEQRITVEQAMEVAEDCIDAQDGDGSSCVWMVFDMDKFHARISKLTKR